MVMKRHLNSTRTNYWWPRREDDEAIKNAAPDEENVDSIHAPVTEVKSSFTTISQSRKQQVARRVHILGAGNLGAFIAHSLAGIPDRPPITLLLRRRQLRVWEDYDCSIEITTHGMKEIRRGFDAEAIHRLPENPSTEVENRSANGEELSNKTEVEGRQDSLPSDMITRSRDILHVNTPSSKESNPDAADGLQHDRPGDGIFPEVSLARNEDPSKLETRIDVRFTQAEQDVHKSQQKVEDIETSRQVRFPDDQEETIYHLIVSVKAPQTVKAIQAVAHRLTKDSSILFLQNGMGIAQEVNEKIFPNEKHRPTYIVGVVSHGLYSKRPFCVVHAGEGTIALGVLPRMPMDENIQLESLNQLSTSARYLMRTMTRTAVFVAVGFSPTDLLQQQLDKLAVNCIINPLTAILDCKNGALLYNFYFTRVIRLLLAEISLVIKSLPELKNVPNVNMRFDTLRLERLVSSIAKTTAENYSSMVQDIRSGRLTEIDYINGYIVKRGEEMGIHCVMNYMLMHMVKGKNKNSFQEKVHLLPLAGQRN